MTITSFLIGLVIGALLGLLILHIYKRLKPPAEDKEEKNLYLHLLHLKNEANRTLDHYTLSNAGVERKVDDKLLSYLRETKRLATVALQEALERKHRENTP
jgi:hypothetical protein